MKLPRSVTLVGVLVALAAVLLDAQVNQALGSLFGEAAAEKLAAIGAVLAAVGRALFGGPPTPPPQGPPQP